MIRITNVDKLRENEKPIGQGSYSKVYVVHQNGQDYAVKQLKREAASKVYLENIHHEVSILSKLNH